MGVLDLIEGKSLTSKKWFYMLVILAMCAFVLGHFVWATFFGGRSSWALAIAAIFMMYASHMLERDPPKGGMIHYEAYLYSPSTDSCARQQSVVMARALDDFPYAAKQVGSDKTPNEAFIMAMERHAQKDPRLSSYANDWRMATPFEVKRWKEIEAGQRRVS